MSPIDLYDELAQHLAQAKERFDGEVEGAAMTVLKDDGAYRHLRFVFPRASWAWCEVVTWPGALVLRGGLGSWMFVDTEDVTKLFRPNSHSERVNPLYWEGKLAPGSGTARVHSPERAVAHIRQTVADMADTFPRLPYDIDSDLLDGRLVNDLSTEGGLRAAIRAFEEMHGCSYEGLYFDVESWDLKRFDPWFLLACVVLPWAVEQLDAALVPAR
ncbi:hypothetical protein [Streptomyces sp. NPDC053427]|uniref:hypothetical protein n=1 Tax=Streptomyces sp. NPDC053427 TaxID=3365701 RepID=UPI0037D59838